MHVVKGIIVVALFWAVVTVLAIGYAQLTHAPMWLFAYPPMSALWGVVLLAEVTVLWFWYSKDDDKNVFPAFVQISLVILAPFVMMGLAHWFPVCFRFRFAPSLIWFGLMSLVPIQRKIRHFYEYRKFQASLQH